MAMYKNIKRDALNDELKKGGISHGYYVGEFHNKTDYPINKASDIWYSYDDESGNFHIVPDIKVGKDFADNADVLFRKIDDEMKNLTNSEFHLNMYSGISHNAKGRNPCVKCHKYKTAIADNSDNYGYLISFNRLWCDADNHIHNNFGQVQFMRYRIKCDNGKELADRYQNINWDVDPKFKMMYPTSDETAEGGANYTFNLNDASGHLSYNAPFDIKSDAETIAKAFAKFIEICEKTGEDLEKQLNEEYKKYLTKELDCSIT